MSHTEAVIVGLIILLALFATWLLRKAGEDLNRLNLLKERLGIINAIVTTGAITVGGIWAYDAFIAGRVNKAKIDIEQEVTSRLINNDFFFVHVSVALKNVGSRHVELREGTSRAQAIYPLWKPHADILGAGQDLVPTPNSKTGLPEKSSKVVAMWPLLCHRKHMPPLKIEPGETQRADFDFFVPRALKTIKIYSEFPDPSDQRSREDGRAVWARTTIHDLQQENSDKRNGAEDDRFKNFEKINFVCSDFDSK